MDRTLNIDVRFIVDSMRIQYKWVMLFLSIVSLSACVMPRLGLESVRYDNISRQATPANQFIPIYDSRQDVPFTFIVIGEVIAAPAGAERDFGYDPIELLRSQAREMGGVGLLEVKSGLESRHVWKGKVIIKKE